MSIQNTKPPPPPYRVIDLCFSRIKRISVPAKGAIFHSVTTRETQTDFGAGQKCEQPVHYSSHLSDSIPPIYHRWRNSGRHNSRKKVKKGLPPKKVPFMIANPIDSPQKQGMHARKASTIREPSGERRRPLPLLQTRIILVLQ